MDDFLFVVLCPILSLNVLNVLVPKGLHLMCFYLGLKRAWRLYEGSNFLLILLTARKELLQTLEMCGFKYQEFLLSPTCVSTKIALLLFNCSNCAELKNFWKWSIVLERTVMTRTEDRLLKEKAWVLISHLCTGVIILLLLLFRS